VASITPPSGIHGGQSAAEVRIYFRVDDIEAAAARVRALGGEVLSIDEYESGGNAECRDDQGLRFDLFRPRAGY
jgi:predicted enzyme related to lactoylglutathione lyase